MLFIMVKEIHNYSFLETVRNVLITIFTMGLFLLTSYILYVLFNQLFDFHFCDSSGGKVTWLSCEKLFLGMLLLCLALGTLDRSPVCHVPTGRQPGISCQPGGFQLP